MHKERPSKAAMTAAFALGMLYDRKGHPFDTNEEFVAHLDQTFARWERMAGIRFVTEITETHDLFELGEPVPVVATAGDHKFVWLNDVADAIGWNHWSAAKWASAQLRSELEDQRAMDINRGELGYELISIFDAGVFVWTGPGTAADHADEDGGWSREDSVHFTDLYLVDVENLASLLIDVCEATASE